VTEGFQGPFKMLLAQMEDNLMSTNTSNEKGTPQSRTYTVNDIAAILGIGRATAYKLANSGLFKTIRIGNMIRISRKSFEDWLKMEGLG
jgi:excisionase family DNA binding protein